MGERDGTPEFYLEMAALLRLNAEKATTPDIQDELLKIATAFERLAMRDRRSGRQSR